MSVPSTIAEQLVQLGMTKAAIRAALEAKGVTVPDDATFRDYAILVAAIATGIAEETDPTVPDHVKAITAEAIAAWTAKYALPTGGIPLTDLAESVRASLQRADNAVTDISGKQDTISDLSTIRQNATAGAAASQALSGKQDTISDLSTIRQNATAGAAASQALSGKVDKVSGKGLSTNDYTTAEKSKLANIEAGAQKNVQPDWNATSGAASILHKPTIPSAVSEQTIAGWGFTKNTGSYTKPAAGIPDTDLTSAVRALLSKANSALQEHQSIKTLNGAPMTGTGDVQIPVITVDSDILENSVNPVAGGTLYSALDLIMDNVAQFAQLVSVAYQKPTGGIPLTDLNQELQRQITGALQLSTFSELIEQLEIVAAEIESMNPYTLPEGGIPLSDLAQSVRASLQKADNAITDVSTLATKTEVNTAISALNSSMGDVASILDSINGQII